MTDCGVRSFWFSVCLLISKARSWQASCRVWGAQSSWVGPDPRAADWEAQGDSERVSAYWWVGWQRAGLAERTRTCSEWLRVQGLGSNDGCLVGCPTWHLWCITGRRVHFPNQALASLWVDWTPDPDTAGCGASVVLELMSAECSARCDESVVGLLSAHAGWTQLLRSLPGALLAPGAAVSPLVNGTWAHVGTKVVPDTGG